MAEDPSPLNHQRTPSDRQIFSDDRPVAQLFTELTRETTALFRKEVELARAELSRKVADAGSGAMMAIAGGLILFVAVQALVAAIVIGLALIMEWWLAALVVAAFLLLLGGIVLSCGLAHLKAQRLAPERTLHSIRDNARWAREQMR